MQGFSDLSRHLNLTAGSAFDLPLTVAVAGVEDSVTVSGDTTLLEAARSQIAGTVPQSEVQSLPMNGRNFLDLALLIPGVSPTNIGSTQLFAETSAVPGQGISIASQRNLSNNFIVDGLSANDDAAGLSGIPYGVDAVEQLQVVTSGGQAELGRALGGYINVVTKSGTNAFRGTVYDFIRDDSFNAPNALSGTTLPMDQQQYGGSLGGPLVRNRTFFFANFEQRLLDQTGLVTILPENVPRHQRAPGAPAIRDHRSRPASIRIRFTTRMCSRSSIITSTAPISSRFDTACITSHRDNSRGAGALNAPSASAGLDNVDHSLAFGNTWTISPQMVNETRAQFVYSDLNAPPTDLIGPAVSIAGVASFGTLVQQPDQAPEQDVSGRRQPVAPGRRARAAGRSRFRLQRRHHHLPALVPWQLRVLVDGEFPGRQLQRLHANVRRSGRVADEPERRHVRAGRVACRRRA